jgi:hypothetical protein
MMSTGRYASQFAWLCAEMARPYLADNADLVPLWLALGRDSAHPLQGQVIGKCLNNAEMMLLFADSDLSTEAIEVCIESLCCAFVASIQELAAAHKTTSHSVCFTIKFEMTIITVSCPRDVWMRYGNV